MLEYQGCEFVCEECLVNRKTLKNAISLFRFCIINAGVLYLYFSSFQQVDEEDYGGTWELTKEGFMTSFALFLVRVLMFINTE